MYLAGPWIRNSRRVHALDDTFGIVNNSDFVVAIKAWLNFHTQIALGQSLAITAIVVEVVFIAIALAIVMLIHRKKDSLSTRKLTNLKG